MESRLRELGIELPAPPAPVGAYVAVRRSGRLLFVSGQIPLMDGKPRFLGKVGADLSVEEGKAAA
ncbi:MAG: RidA family protein [Nitrospinota bacterium]|nr:RidA family protein [Nitrospinota bacterium]MDP6483044.1 RidA family protein [Nitrospinota bacterium]MDP6618563.1 RidA family protein [Nitrospinota bacterium]HJM43281.1 RidA family protein [Nitrospinota bacterium]